jgi:hypothetical protein
MQKTILILMGAYLFLAAGCDDKERFSRYPSLSVPEFEKADYIRDLTDPNPERANRIQRPYPGRPAGQCASVTSGFMEGHHHRTNPYTISMVFINSIYFIVGLMIDGMIDLRLGHVTRTVHRTIAERSTHRALHRQSFEPHPLIPYSIVHNEPPRCLSCYCVTHHVGLTPGPAGAFKDGGPAAGSGPDRKSAWRLRA